MAKCREAVIYNAVKLIQWEFLVKYIQHRADSLFRLFKRIKTYNLVPASPFLKMDTWPYPISLHCNAIKIDQEYWRLLASFTFFIPRAPAKPLFAFPDTIGQLGAIADF